MALKPTAGVLAVLSCLCASPLWAESPGPWVASWTASAHGPYPVGNATAQPELKFALPPGESGAEDQTFRMLIRPDVWGKQARIRLSNFFGSQPVTFDGTFVGLSSSGPVLVPGTNRPVTFGGKGSITVPPGKVAVSDPVALPWVKDPTDPMLTNRRLAVSFHVAGASGAITWHAKALTTSYLTGPKTGAHGADIGEEAFPFSTTSWFFLDDVEMTDPGAKTIVAFGDSITDGTASTLNGDDRWPDVFSRRLHEKFGQRYSVVNEGIGGNMILGPENYASKPFAGGPAALERLDRDVISLPNVATVIWLEGINDFGNAGADVKDVTDGVRSGVAHLRSRIPGVKIFMATLTSSLHSVNGSYGAFPIEEKRRAFNEFVRTSGIFDGVVDFDAATFDAVSGE